MNTLLVVVVDHTFPTIKDRHGCTGLLCRVIKLAAAEMAIGAGAYNFTRVVYLVRLDLLLGAVQNWPAPQPA